MSTLWSDLGPQLWAAFWLTIKLTIYSAIGSMIVGTILTAMRVAPIPVLRAMSTFYINVVRNTPLTLIIIFCSFGLYQNLGITLADRESATFLVDNNFRLAVLGFTSTPRHSSQNRCAPASTPSTSDKPKPPDPSASASAKHSATSSSPKPSAQPSCRSATHSSR